MNYVARSELNVRNIRSDLGFKLDHGLEDAAADFSAGDGREEAFDSVQRQSTSRRRRAPVSRTEKRHKDLRRLLWVE